MRVSNLSKNKSVRTAVLAIAMFFAGIGAAVALHVHAAGYQTAPWSQPGFSGYTFHYEGGGDNNANWAEYDNP